MSSSNKTGLRIAIQQTSPIPLNARFSCAPKEVLALVGPSGGGKSTLLRAIAGIFKPAQCEVSVDGEVWSSSTQRIHLPTHRRRVGMVFQGYALFPHMSILNNVAAAISGRKAQQRRHFAATLLTQVNLSGLENRKPHELSGGQQQRVAVARALAREPSVLLLDEPFAAVDKITRRRLYREVIKLRRELQIPIILVTHDLDEAVMLADKMAVLHHGTTLQTGTPEQITTRPASAELARLVDIRNVFDGQVKNFDTHSGQCTLKWAGSTLSVTGVTEKDLKQNQQVQWAIPDGSVVIQRTDRPSSRELINQISASVEDILLAGQTAQLILKPDCQTNQRLHASVPLRIVRLNHIEAGSTLTISLTPQDIHIMSS